MQMYPLACWDIKVGAGLAGPRAITLPNATCARFVRNFSNQLALLFILKLNQLNESLLLQLNYHHAVKLLRNSRPRNEKLFVDRALRDYFEMRPIVACSLIFGPLAYRWSSQLA